MKLYLIRHAHALSSGQLSEIGKKQAEKKAKELNLDGFEIWYSEKQRAKQTAELLAPHQKRIEKEGLKPTDPVQPIINELLVQENDLAIVGHLPFLEDLLLELNVQSVQFDNVTVVALEKNGATWTFLGIK